MQRAILTLCQTEKECFLKSRARISRAYTRRFTFLILQPINLKCSSCRMSFEKFELAFEIQLRVQILLLCRQHIKMQTEKSITFITKIRVDF